MELLEATLMGGIGSIDDCNAHDDFDPVFDKPALQLSVDGIAQRRSRYCEDGLED